MQARILFLFTTIFVVGAEEETSLLWYSQCRDQGYDAGRLRCSTCTLLSKSLGPTHPTIADCKSCCSPQLDIGSVTSRQKFDTVSLRLCRASPGGGGVNEWLEKREAEWEKKGVVVDDHCSMFGELPSIVLKNDGDEEEDVPQEKKTKKKSKSGALLETKKGLSVPITTWKVEHIDAFISAALKS